MRFKLMKKIRLLVLPILLVAVVSCSSQDTTPVQADNTARNAQSPSAKTATDQAENETDREISANVRKAVVADDSLSMDAHNVKIITSGGVVTLRGPVKTQQEKTAIETKAKQVAGVVRVENLLEVATR
jgi:osmotically-inducible protein OsmY